MEKLKSLIKSVKTSSWLTRGSRLGHSKKESISNKKDAIHPEELGKHEVPIPEDQLPKGWLHLHDLLLVNPQSPSGYSHIDHVIITPQCLFIVESKNYHGEIKGMRIEEEWTLRKQLKIPNPFIRHAEQINAIKSHLSDYKELRVISLISFTLRARLNLENELRQMHSDELVGYNIEIFEMITRKFTRLKTEHPAAALSDLNIRHIYETLKKGNVTYKGIRAEHEAAQKGS